MARRVQSTLVALATVLVVVPVSSSAVTSLTPNFDPTTVHYGDSASFTAVYPKDATRSVTTVQHENPDVDLRCYQSSTTAVYWQILSFPTERRNTDGTITGVTNSVVLGGASRDGTWSGGSATCYATLYYFSKDKSGNLIEHTLATFTFGVLA